MYKNCIACSLAAIILFVAVIVAVRTHGSRNRIFAPEQETVRVDTPQQAYEIWQNKRVQGRILILFDNYPHMRGRINYDGIPQLGASNLVEYSIFKNVVRKIYFIVPDSKWEDFLQQKTMKHISPIMNMERGVYLYNLNGLPMILTTPSSLPHISEQTLVYINNQVFDTAQIQALLTQRNITSDITVIYQENNQ